jgi:single-strand DNA-binding protein
MAGETTITVIGNLTADPELRFTPSGSAVANFTLASTPRTFNRQSNEWEDGETLFLRASVWREAAENVAETLVKGMRVIAQGRLKSRSYETKEGEKRTVIELEIDEIGPSLRYAQAKVTRVQGKGQQGQGGQQQDQWNGGGQQAGAGQWGGQQAAGGQWGGGGGFGGQQPVQQQQAGNWNQTAAQQQVAAQAQGQWGGQPQGQGQPQTAPAQQYAQAAATGPQPGAQQYAQQPAGQVDPAQAARGQDPWATPGVSNGGGWGNGPDSEPPF